MRELIADFFVSTDGFASGEDGTQNWIRDFFEPEMMNYIQGVLAQPQVLIIGRKTYEVLFGYWPEAREPQALQMNELPKIVFSKTIIHSLEWNNARLATKSLVDEINTLKRDSGPQLRSIGSLELVRNMIDLGLVDRIRLMVFPVILGSTGRERVFDGYPLQKLKVAEQKIIGSNILMVDYRVCK